MAGAGYKLFNTGDVLTAAQVNTYLQEQVVMVFNDATARTTALSGVLAEGMVSYLKSTKVVEIYNGTAWASLDDPNAIQNTIVDAKGDLISASGNDVPARLAVGNDGETLVADSSASTGLRWQGNFAAGKNKIINGDFGIWQRGTSFSNPTDGTYTADRFAYFGNGSGVTRTISRQTFTPGAAPVAGYEGKFFFRINQSVAGTSGSYSNFQQRIEDVQTFAGQTVTISFWAKADASRNVTPNFIQAFGSGGSADVYTTGSAVTLTTSWTRYTQTFNIPSISGKTVGTGSHLSLYFDLPLNTTYTIDFWGLQVENGSVATPFQTATGTLAGELMAAQRYYYRVTASDAYSQFGFGMGTSTTNVKGTVPFRTQLRTVPSSIDSGNLAVYDGTNVTAITSIALNNQTAGHEGGFSATVASGLTQYRPYSLITNNNTAGYIAFNAEL